jgi:hypothetical protein
MKGGREADCRQLAQNLNITLPRTAFARLK